MNSPKNTLEISLPKKPFSVAKLQKLYEESESNKFKILESKKSDIKNDPKLSQSAKELAIKVVKLLDFSTGIVVFLSMIFIINPLVLPSEASIPNDRGVTSKRTISFILSF